MFPENYHLHPEYSVLTQIEREPFEYTEAYTQAYNKLDCHSLSKLRYDYLVQTIGRKPWSVLDIGYGNGSFLSYCHEQGVQFTYGFDVAPTDPPKTAKRVSSISNGFYDVISFFDSLEHCEDIGKEIDSLAPHNYVIISLPQCREYLAPDYDLTGFSNEWFMQFKHRKKNEHLWHFSESALALFMTSKGYEAVDWGNPEDAIRKPSEKMQNIFSGELELCPNILTGVFKKIENVDTTGASTRK